MKSKLVYLADFRKQKEIRHEEFEEARDFLNTIFPTRRLSKEDEDILKEIGVPMVEFSGSTLKGEADDLSEM